MSAVIKLIVDGIVLKTKSYVPKPAQRTVPVVMAFIQPIITTFIVSELVL